MSFESDARRYLNPIHNERPSRVLPPGLQTYITNRSDVLHIADPHRAEESGMKFRYDDYAREMAMLMPTDGVGQPSEIKTKQLNVFNASLYFLPPEKTMNVYIQRLKDIDRHFPGIYNFCFGSTPKQFTDAEEAVYTLSQKKERGYDESPIKFAADWRRKLMSVRAAFDMCVMYFPDDRLSELVSLVAPPEMPPIGRYDWVHRYSAERLMEEEVETIADHMSQLVPDVFMRIQKPKLDRFIEESIQNDYPTPWLSEMPVLDPIMRQMYRVGTGMTTHSINQVRNYLSQVSSSRLHKLLTPQDPYDFVPHEYIEDYPDAEFDINLRAITDMIRKKCPGMDESYRQLVNHIARHYSPETRSGFQVYPESDMYPRVQRSSCYLELAIAQGMAHGIKAYEENYPNLMEEIAKKE